MRTRNNGLVWVYLLFQVLTLLQFSSGFVPHHYHQLARHHCRSVGITKNGEVVLRVYTPEQEQDDKKRQLEEEEAAAASISDEVLSSLSEKLRSNTEDNDDDEPKKEDNKAMAFLRKMGKVGGAANKNFVNAVGSDEGSTGRQPPAQRDSGGGNGAAAGSGLKKAMVAYKECTDTGIIDDLTEPFPLTKSGNEWRGISDRVMGGMSDGFIKRETIQGRPANILSGHVSLANGGGFIQMVTDLPLDPMQPSVDASDYDGIEITVLCNHHPLQFNIHLRTPGTLQQASYRHTVELETSDNWETIRIPFSSFKLHGAEHLPVNLDYSALKRIGIVAIGQEMDVSLAVGDVRFYSVI